MIARWREKATTPANWTKVHRIREGDTQRAVCGRWMPAAPHAIERDEQIPVEHDLCRQCVILAYQQLIRSTKP